MKQPKESAIRILRTVTAILRLAALAMVLFLAASHQAGLDAQAAPAVSAAAGAKAAPDALPPGIFLSSQAWSDPAAAWFEKPRELAAGNLRYEQTLQLGERVAVLYQRISGQTAEGGEIAVVGRLIEPDGSRGEEFTVVAGLPYVGIQPPPLYSAAADAKGRIYVAYSADAQTVALLASRDALAAGGSHAGGAAAKPAGRPVFSELGQLDSDTTLVAPRLYLTGQGGYVLLATQSTATSQNSVYSRSATGKTWSAPLMVDTGLKDNINVAPVWAELGKREFVYFQSLNFANQTGVRNYYQVYQCHSDDGGQTWSAPAVFTGFGNPGDKAANAAADYDNERPLAVVQQGRLRLFWERGFRTDPRQIWTVAADADGQASGEPAAVSASPGGALAPVWQAYRGREFISWFTASQRGSRAYLGWKDGAVWKSREMSAGRGGSALYPAFGFTQGKLHYFYYDRLEASSVASSLVYVEPDQQARPPVLVGVNFDNGRRATHADIQLRLLPNNQPGPDPAGIAGYSWVLSQEADSPVPARVSPTGGDGLISQTLDGDGTWYLRARALDKAGNWSEPATISYILDTTPPEPVSFNPIALDEKGWLASNTFSVSWQTPGQDDVSQYGYSLQFLGNISLSEAYGKIAAMGKLPEMGRQAGTSIARRNVQNGIYVLAVWAYDSVGNRSEPRVIELFANKYIPSTIVDFIKVDEDMLGERYLSVQGQGFVQNGTIVRLVLDRDGIPPWDNEFFLSRGDYRVPDDRLISGLRLNKLLSGNYLLGVEHSERGFEFGGRRLVFAEHGVIKFGDFSVGPKTAFTATVEHRLQVQGGSLLLWLAMALLGIIVVFAGFQIRAVISDSHLLEQTALALADGTNTPVWIAERKVHTMKKQSLGLRLKFTIFFLLLVVAVVLLISLPLSSYTLASQKAVLAKGLQERLTVLMGSLQSSATIYLQNPDSYGTELAQLTEQGRNIDVVSYITVTAQGRENSPNFDTVWATNDTAITGDQPAEAKAITAITQRRRAPFTVNGVEQNVWVQGRSGIVDSLSPAIAGQQAEFDKRFREGLGTLPADINTYSTQLKGLLLNTTKEGQAEATRVDEILRSLRSQLTERLNKLAGDMASQPAYDYATYDPAVEDYIFYKPIYFRVAGEDAATARYYRGLVRVGVSTVPINQQISATQNEIVQRILLFALLAIGGGLVVAIVLSSIIVIPIRRLVRGVEAIREIITLDVEAQEKGFGEFLKSDSIRLKSRDELATLGGSIIEMVDGLHHAATANKDLVAGSDIQRMFMPLDLIQGVRGTVGGVETPKTEIFGYYEGAKGVSGDFINFQQISPGVWACIKCDISGKGIPAALIMVEVATIFLSYFADWQRKEAERRKLVGAAGKAARNDGILVPLVTTINDLVNERQFKGRFAAFDIVLYEENTGACVFCHAGDQLVYILRDKTRTVETIKLQSTPAAGMFSSKDEFPPFFRCREERNLLEVGDFLMFFTDGIDESRRFFRTPDFKEYLATEEDVQAGRIPDENHGSVKAQQEDPNAPARYEYEQFTWDRMIEVGEAVRKRQVYRLVKYLNPIPDEVLEFDFTNLEPTGRNIVIALSAVEKVFRLIPNPALGSEDRIRIDKVVDEFLKVHFRQYSGYFRYRREEFKNPLYHEYTHLGEEAQFDDLAYLIIRRK